MYTEKRRRSHFSWRCVVLYPLENQLSLADLELFGRSALPVVVQPELSAPRVHTPIAQPQQLNIAMMLLDSF